MLYSSYFYELFYNLQEPYRFLVFIIMSILFSVSLFSNEIISEIELHKRILANIREKKVMNPNCVIFYSGKIF